MNIRDFLDELDRRLLATFGAGGVDKLAYLIFIPLLAFSSIAALMGFVWLLTTLGPILGVFTVFGVLFAAALLALDYAWFTGGPTR